MEGVADARTTTVFYSRLACYERKQVIYSQRLCWVLLSSAALEHMQQGSCQSCCLQQPKVNSLCMYVHVGVCSYHLLCMARVRTHDKYTCIRGHTTKNRCQRVSHACVHTYIHTTDAASSAGIHPGNWLNSVKPVCRLYVRVHVCICMCILVCVCMWLCMWLCIYVYVCINAKV